MATLDVRMEALVRGSDGETLGRIWAMLLAKQGRDYAVTHLLIEGGALERDALLPFELVRDSSDQVLTLKAPKATALAQAVLEPPAGAMLLRRNDPVYAVDARLGHIRGFFVNEAGTISDILLNDEVDCRLSMTSIRAVDTIEPHRIDLWSRISAMGELMKPPQAFYAPVELRSEEEVAHAVHGAPGSHGQHG